MNVKKIGKVNIGEKRAMEKIYNKRAALDELIFTICKESSPELYKKVSDDLNNAIDEYKNWWKNISEKYNWIIGKDEYLILDFNTCDVIVEKSNNCESKI